MGQVADKPEWKNSDMSQNFMKIKVVNDKSLGNVTVVCDRQTNAQYFLKRRPLPVGEDPKKFCNEVYERSSFTHPNLLRIFGYLRMDNLVNQRLLNDEFASSGHHLTSNSNVYLLGGQQNNMGGQLADQKENTTDLALILEHITYNLDEELKKRRSKMKYFTEAELWYFAFSLIGAGHFLQEKSLCHGNIRPQNILLTSDGKVKIYDNAIVHAKAFEIETLRANIGYLSPLIMQNVAKGQWVTPQNFFKSDVFSFGLSLLEAATLAVIPNVIYDPQTGSLNTLSIQSLLGELESRYSENFSLLVASCLHLDERIRPDWVDLEKKYQTKLSPAIYSNVLNGDAAPKKIGNQMAEQQAPLSAAGPGYKSKQLTVHPHHIPGSRNGVALPLRTASSNNIPQHMTNSSANSNMFHIPMQDPTGVENQDAYRLNGRPDVSSRKLAARTTSMNPCVRFAPNEEFYFAPPRQESAYFPDRNENPQGSHFHHPMTANFEPSGQQRQQLNLSSSKMSYFMNDLGSTYRPTYIS